MAAKLHVLLMSIYNGRSYGKLVNFWWAVESPISLLTPYIKMILGFSRIKHFETIIMW